MRSKCRSMVVGTMLRVSAVNLCKVMAAAVLLCTCFVSAASAWPAHVLLVESHNDVLAHWVESGIKGAVVVNVDIHDNCVPIAAVTVNRLLAAAEASLIVQMNAVADSTLYGNANFISAANTIGIAREAVWVTPTLRIPGLVREHLPFRISSMDSLPPLRNAPVLLTVDAVCVPLFATQRCITKVEAVHQIGETLRNVPWNVLHVSVSFSVDGGFLPVTLRWIGTALKETFEGKDPSRRQSPWLLLGHVDDWSRGLPAGEVVRKVRPLVQRRPSDPYLHVYLAEALYKTGDRSGALREGLKASRLDPGCSRILPVLGSQSAAAGLLDEAERFLTAAPSVVDIAAEQAMAQAYERAGRTADAIKHLTRIRGQQANYSVELLIGFGYERLGDTASARIHYRRAVALLAAPVGEMPSFPDVGPAVAAAARLLQNAGDGKQAQALRRDPRLTPFFYTDGDEIEGK